MDTPNHCQSSSSMEVCSSTHLQQASFDGQMDASKLERTNDVEQLDTNENSPKKLDADEVSRALDDGACASASAADAAADIKSSVRPDSQAQGDDKDGDPCNKAASVDDVRSVETDGTGIKDSGSANDCDGAVASRAKDDGNSRTKSSSHEHSLGNVNESATYLSRMEDMCIDEVEEHSSGQSSGHQLDAYEIAKSEINVKNYDGREKSNVELDYDMVDPLEVARQVAREVEREVGDRREQSCSSSEKASQNPDSSDSDHETESRAQEESSEEVPLRLDLSAEDQATSPESLETEEPNKGTLGCSQLTEVAQGLPADTEKGMCNFDLNEEVSLEDEDQQQNPMATTISIVSASRATAAPGLPNAPLQFEGSLGWKGSAATSAFRPASPRRIPEGDKVNSTGGSSSSSRQRDGYLDIDLNVDDCENDKADDQTVENQIRGSGLPSGESSVEVSTRVSERLEFDLNRGTDDSDAPSVWQTEWRHQQRNGCVGRSLSSSSSSEQHSLRNIDLNGPSSPSESPDRPGVIKFSQNFNAPGVKKSDGNVISIMGMKVEVNRKDLIPQSHSLLNGRIPDATVDLNLSRSGSILGIGSTVAYSNSPVYGYNGLTLGPAMALSSGVNIVPGGPIPSYMLDSRGAPVIPQVMGSTPALPPAFSQPSPFMMNIPGSNGPPCSSFDLNSGLFLEAGGGGGNRESGGLRQFLSTGQTRPIHDQLKSSSQLSSSSGVGGKRKEPELGWEPYPFRNQPPPTWK